MTARAKLNMSALKAVAQPQPDPVEIANRDAAPAVPQRRPAAPRAAAPRVEPKAEKAAPARQASRIGKSGVQFWTAPEQHKRLKLAALDLDRTVDDIVNEAVAQWLAREDRG